MYDGMLVEGKKVRVFDMTKKEALVLRVRLYRTILSNEIEMVKTGMITQEEMSCLHMEYNEELQTATYYIGEKKARKRFNFTFVDSDDPNA